VEGHKGRHDFASKTMVTSSPKRRSGLKTLLAAPLRLWLTATAKLRQSAKRVYAHASLASELTKPLPMSVVVLDRLSVHGTGEISFGEDCFLYPEIHLETQGAAAITVGAGVVINRGTHLVAMSGITIGKGSMIGEYASIRDANHRREEGVSIRDAGHISSAIVIGNEVWIGRGVTVLGGVTIGDGATVGANAVVTRDVEAGSTVVGVPARPIQKVDNA